MFRCKDSFDQTFPLFTISNVRTILCPFPVVSGQQKRRTEADQRRKATQAAILDQARRLAHGNDWGEQYFARTTNEVDTGVDTIMGICGEDGTGMDASKLQKVAVQKLYRNALMLPEYLSDIPIDFAESWTCVPLPIGKRCIVVSRSGVTEARDINGELLESFESLLPNGAPRTANPSKYFCLLDCIRCDEPLGFTSYEDLAVDYYVLDMMVWNGIFFYNCSTESRFWLRNSKLEELGSAQDARTCRRRFISLPNFTCDRKGVLEAVNANVSPLGGVLFYHVEVEYRPHETPFMCGLPIDKVKDLMCSLPR